MSDKPSSARRLPASLPAGIEQLTGRTTGDAWARCSASTTSSSASWRAEAPRRLRQHRHHLHLGQRLDPRRAPPHDPISEDGLATRRQVLPLRGLLARAADGRRARTSRAQEGRRRRSSTPTWRRRSWASPGRRDAAARRRLAVRAAQHPARFDGRGVLIETSRTPAEPLHTRRFARTATGSTHRGRRWKGSST